MKKGAITVFLAMVFPILLALLLTLVESSRSAGIRAVARASGNAAVNSLFGAYNRTLFDEYGLLFLDGGYGGGLVDFEKLEEEFSGYFQNNETGGNLVLGGSFFPVELQEVHVTDLVTATDYNGEVFIRSALDFFKFDLAGETLESVLGCINGMEDGEKAKGEGDAGGNELDSTDWSKYEVGTAAVRTSPVRTMGLVSSTGKVVFTTDQTLKDPTDPELPSGSGSGNGMAPGTADGPKAGSGGGHESDAESEPDGEPESEPEYVDGEKLKSTLKDSAIGRAKRSKAEGWLRLVLPDQVTVSEYVLDREELPSETAVDDRKTEYQESILEDGLKRITFCEYLLRHFSNYSNEQEAEGPAYEVEYLVFGNASDRKNFETALNRIMWIREGMNLLHLASSDKRYEAKAAATLIAGWTGVPLIVELTAIALMAAWAYAESILDVRALLERKRVPFFKTEETWTLSLNGIGNLLDGGSEAVTEDRSGIRYEDYLRIFLYLSDLHQSAYRAMDLIQVHLRMRSERFMMTSQVYAAEFTAVIHAGEIFTALPLFRKSRLFLNGYTFEERYSEVY